LVVIGADPLGAVDRALLERGIDVGAAQLLRHHAELGQYRAAPAADAELDALQIVDRLDFLAPPAARLGPGVAGRHGKDVVILEEVVDRNLPAALAQPRIHD